MSFRLSRVDLLLLLMVIFWGANLTVIKIALRHFDPVVFNCLRFTLASLVMALLYRKIFKDRLPRRSWVTLIILGFLGNTVYQFFFIFGMKWTHVAHVSLLLAVAPIFTALLSRVLALEIVGQSICLGLARSFGR